MIGLTLYIYHVQVIYLSAARWVHDIDRHLARTSCHHSQFNLLESG